ncbi:MAG: DUF4382 domain-containing protein [Cyanobacteria bacterium J06621_8]
MNQNSVNTANGGSKLLSFAFKFNVVAISSLLVIGSSKAAENNSPAKVAHNHSEGTLSLVANGEDFVRQGFVTKDGWSISFDRVAVNLSDVTAYQMASSFQPTEANQIDNLEYQEKVALVDTPQIVDLAEGEADADPIMVTSMEVTSGFYNAVAWKMDTAGDNSALAGKTMELQGTASKDDQVINFDLSLNRPLHYLCGEYVGDDRKGMVQAGGIGEVETTFHFDHIFGDGEASADDAINVGALGFTPLAQLASSEQLIIDDATLSQQLSSEDQEKLTKAIIGLGHVGEGHCAVIE